MIPSPERKKKALLALIFLVTFGLVFGIVGTCESFADTTVDYTPLVCTTSIDYYVKGITFDSTWAAWVVCRNGQDYEIYHAPQWYDYGCRVFETITVNTPGDYTIFLAIASRDFTKQTWFEVEKDTIK